MTRFCQNVPFRDFGFSSKWVGEWKLELVPGTLLIERLVGTGKESIKSSRSKHPLIENKGIVSSFAVCSRILQVVSGERLGRVNN